MFGSSVTETSETTGSFASSGKFTFASFTASLTLSIDNFIESAASNCTITTA